MPPFPAFLVTLWLSQGVSGAIQTTETPSPVNVVQSIKRAWDSITSINAVIEESVADSNDRFDPTKARMVFVVKYGGGDRWSLEFKGRDSRDRSVKEKTIQNSGILHVARYSFEDTDSMASLATKYSPSVTGEFSTHMGILMSLMLPGGKSVPNHLADGATIEQSKDNQGKTAYVLSTKFKGNPLICTLDPEHDWLVKQMKMGQASKPVTTTVTKFEKHNGRWFPIEAVRHRPDAGTGEPSTMISRIVSLQVNQAIPIAAFSPPKPQPGTLVEDAIKGTITVIPTVSSQKTSPERASAPLPASEPLVAVTPSDQTAWYVAACLGVLVVSVVAVFRRRAS